MSAKDLSKIKLFAMDVDGTLTDGHIYMGNDGEIMKAFNAKDGLGINQLQNIGIVTAIITGRTSKIVENRCQELGISELHQGIAEKGQVLSALTEKYHLSPDEVAYIGDDLNDMGAFSVAGITFAPADCARQIIPFIDIHLSRKAVECAVREATDMILESHNK